MFGVVASSDASSEYRRSRSVVAHAIDHFSKSLVSPGPVLLARNTGVPIAAFYVAPERAWVLKSWDRMLIPKPFSRVSVRIGRYIRVPENAKAGLEQLHATMQAALEEVQAEGESAFRQS